MTPAGMMMTWILVACGGMTRPRLSPWVRAMTPMERVVRLMSFMRCSRQRNSRERMKGRRSIGSVCEEGRDGSGSCRHGSFGGRTDCYRLLEVTLATEIMVNATTYTIWGIGDLRLTPL